MIFIKNKLTYLVLTVLLISCSIEEGDKPNAYIGLYQIIDRQCDASENYLEDCQKAKFIELVKGQFFGVKNDELAVVFWRGHKGEELLYQARKISNQSLIIKSNDKLILSNIENEMEYFDVNNGVLTNYFFSMKKINVGTEVRVNEIKYGLISVKRGLLPEYRMNYPGNN